jgi:hypothetical protein
LGAGTGVDGTNVVSEETGYSPAVAERCQWGVGSIEWQMHVEGCYYPGHGWLV